MQLPRNVNLGARSPLVTVPGGNSVGIRFRVALGTFTDDQQQEYGGKEMTPLRTEWKDIRKHPNTHSKCCTATNTNLHKSHTQAKTDGETERQTDRQRDGETQRDRQSDRETVRQKYRQTGIETQTRTHAQERQVILTPTHSCAQLKIPCNRFPLLMEYFGEQETHKQTHTHTHTQVILARGQQCHKRTVKYTIPSSETACPP